MYYSCTIGVFNLLLIETYIFQALLCTDIPSIVDNETFFDSPLRGNFGPTSTTGSASPSLSGTHCGREHLCGAEGKKEVCQPSEAARGVFSRLPGVHRTHQRRRSRHRRVHSCCRSWINARKDSGHCRWRVNVHRLSSKGRAEPEDCHSASAGSSGTPNIRSSMTRFARLKEKRCRDSEPSPEKLSGTTPLLRCAPGWLRSDPTIFPTNHRDSTLLSPTAPRGRNRLRYPQ